MNKQLTKSEIKTRQTYMGIIIAIFWFILFTIVGILIKIGRYPNEINLDEIEEMYGSLEADKDI